MQYAASSCEPGHYRVLHKIVTRTSARSNFSVIPARVSGAREESRVPLEDAREGPGFFARQPRARMTEQEIEQDRNCRYDLQSSNRCYVHRGSDHARHHEGHSILNKFPAEIAGIARGDGEEQRPVVLTVNGKAEAVLQDAESYQRLLDRAARADVYEAVRQGVDDIVHGRARPARKVFNELRRRHGVSR